jgi:hypothetical protein
MNSRIKIIIAFLIVLLLFSTLCIGDDDGGKKKTKYVKEWWDLSDFNDYLDQTYDVTAKKETGSSMIRSIPEPEGALYIAVGIDKEFSDLEIESLHHFVETGGNILIAGDNSTNINPLSKEFGITYQIYSILDHDFDLNYTFIPANLEHINRTYLILAQSPLGLEIALGGDFRIIAQSSFIEGRVNSGLDINDDQKLGGEDKPGPIPFIVEVSLGKGKAVFFSDAGMFSNNLWTRESLDEKYPDRVYENYEYIIALIESMYTDGSILIYDTSKQTAGFSNFHPYPDEL